MRAVALVLLFLCFVVFCQAHRFEPVEKHVIDTQEGQQVLSWDEVRDMLRNNVGLMDRSYLPDFNMHKIPTLQPSLPENCTRQKVIL